MIFRSPYGDVAVPKIPFHEFVLGRAEQRDSALAFIDPDAQRRVTFGELARDARWIAAGLARRGMRKSDVFALMLPNVPEFATAFFGVLAAGGIVTTLNPLYTCDEIAHQLKDSGAKYLLTIPQCFDRAAAAGNIAGLRELFVVGNIAGGTSFSDLLSDGAVPQITINPLEDVAILPYSSGTTGKPKGVMLTHANLSAGVLAVVIPFPVISEGHIGLGLLPFFHVAGMVCVLHSSLYAGATLVLLRRFDPALLLQMIQDYRIEGVSLVPPILIALTKFPRVEALFSPA